MQYSGRQNYSQPDDDNTVARAAREMAIARVRRLIDARAGRRDEKSVGELDDLRDELADLLSRPIG
jgi:hypothetical protein